MNPVDEHMEKADPETKRGITIMNFVLKAKSKGHILVVDWNNKGQPIGDMKEKFVSYIGVVTRLNVPIIFDDWRKVPKQHKEHIWDDVSVNYLIVYLFLIYLK